MLLNHLSRGWSQETPKSYGSHSIEVVAWGKPLRGTEEVELGPQRFSLPYQALSLKKAPYLIAVWELLFARKLVCPLSLA